MKEVKYLKIKDIANEMYRGSGIKKDQVVSEGYPCVRYGEIYTTYDIAFDKCVSHTTESKISARKYFEKGDILFAITGESIEDIGKSIAYLGEEKCLLGGDIVAMKHNQNPKYLAYALSSPYAVKQKGIGKTKLKVVHTNIPSLKEIVIPIPSPEEQADIVAKLDTIFAKIDVIKHTAKMAFDEAYSLFSAEINSCFNDESLISQSEFIPFEKCLIKVKRQPQIKAKYYLKEGLFPIVSQDASTISGYTNEPSMVYHHERPIIVFGDHTRVVKYIDFDFAVGADGTHILSTIERIEPKYFYYFLKSIKLKSLGYARHFKLLKAYQIAIPPINIQNVVVNKLDTIECKVNKAISNYEKIEKLCSNLYESVLKSIFE